MTRSLGVLLLVLLVTILQLAVVVHVVAQGKVAPLMPEEFACDW